MTFFTKLLGIVPAVCLQFLSSSLHAVEWQEGTGFRSAPLSIPSKGKTGFIQASAATTGILFTNDLPTERYITNQIYLNGSGVAAGDVDGDGRCDLYFCRLGGSNALYRSMENNEAAICATMMETVSWTWW